MLASSDSVVLSNCYGIEESVVLFHLKGAPYKIQSLLLDDNWMSNPFEQIDIDFQPKGFRIFQNMSSAVAYCGIAASFYSLVFSPFFFNFIVRTWSSRRRDNVYSLSLCY